MRRGWVAHTDVRLAACGILRLRRDHSAQWLGLGAEIVVGSCNERALNCTLSNDMLEPTHSPKHTQAHITLSASTLTRPSSASCRFRWGRSHRSHASVSCSVCRCSLQALRLLPVRASRLLPSHAVLAWPLTCLPSPLQPFAPPETLQAPTFAALAVSGEAAPPPPPPPPLASPGGGALCGALHASPRETASAV